jgi:predicted nucleic acid-binding protein
LIVLDASVLIAHFRRSDAHHHAATTLLREATGEALRISTVTLAEVLTGHVRAGTLAEARAALEQLAVREVPLGDGAAEALARLRAQTGLKLPDCCVLLAAQRCDGRVATFDEPLAAAAAELGLRRPAPPA